MSGTQIELNYQFFYPIDATPLAASSGNVAAATATATLSSLAGQTTYISGFVALSGGATAASVVTLTITNVSGGTLSFAYQVPAGATAAAPGLQITFPQPLPAAAQNTTIVVSLPSLGSGNTNTTVTAFGYRV